MFWSTKSANPKIIYILKYIQIVS